MDVYMDFGKFVWVEWVDVDLFMFVEMEIEFFEWDVWVSGMIDLSLFFVV